MIPPEQSAGEAALPTRINWLVFFILAAVLAIAMMRTPVPVGTDAESSYRALLYENLRLGKAWGETLVTTDGPLAAMQAPVYSSGSIWIAMAWQIGGNSVLALILVYAAYQLTTSQRWWALCLLTIALARSPTLAPWIVSILLGWALIRQRERSIISILGIVVILGFLSLSSLGHLLLGSLALALVLVTRHTPKSKVTAIIGFIFTLVVSWLLLGQTLHSLWSWLRVGLPILWQTDPTLYVPEIISPMRIWVALSGLALVISVGLIILKSTNRREFVATGLFLIGTTLLAWKAIALQPFGVTGIFFGTVITAAFLLWQSGEKLAVPLLVAALGLCGLIRWQPLILEDGIGHLNRQLIQNVRLIFNLSELRPSLRAQLVQLTATSTIPRIKATIGTATVDLIGANPGEAILGKLNYRFRPAPMGDLVRSSAIAKSNQQSMTGPDTPVFILQRVQPANNIIPALDDATTQLELYRRYDFVLEEEGLLLWKRKANAADLAASTLVSSGTLSFEQPLSLPPTTNSDTGYWLELDIQSNFFGRLWSYFDKVPQPDIVFHDDADHQSSYVLPAAAAARGFLVTPFLRGEVDLLRLHTATNLPRIKSLSILPPPSYISLWGRQFTYRLYAVSDLKPTGHELTPEVFDRFRLFNRVPTALGYRFPIKVLPYEPDVSIAFTHPDSLIEFALTNQDRRLRASFGLLKNAYQGKNRTDGVDFSVELIPANGSPNILYHRHLNPLSIRGDRGLQHLDINLPEGQTGRLILRTYNPPGRSEAYDWSYWGNITIE